MSNIAFYVVSDVHGYIFPTDFTSRNQYQPMGLLLANHVIEQDRRQYDQSFKIDNGDFLQGSPFCNYLIAHSGSSQPLVDFYNRMAFDFGTLGNHEFNYGLPYLKDTLRRLNYPVLCANIYENDSTLTDNGVQYFQVGDQTVGVSRFNDTIYSPLGTTRYIFSHLRFIVLLKHFNNTYLK